MRSFTYTMLKFSLKKLSIMKYCTLFTTLFGFASCDYKNTWFSFAFFGFFCGELELDCYSGSSSDCCWCGERS